MGDWMSRRLAGDNNPNWNGGTYTEFGSNWFRVRERIRTRDEACQVCGEDGSDCRLDVHHIVPRREFDVVEHSNTPYNLVLLCQSCHKQVEHGSIPCPYLVTDSPNLADKIRRFLILFRMGSGGFEPPLSAL